jgi:putative ATPase
MPLMNTNIPLAEQLRPHTLTEISGQDHLIGSDGLITRIIEGKRPLSILLWGPPGSGKTTIARLYAKAFNAEFIAFSAIFHGTADLKKLIEENKKNPLFQTQKIIFVDEIHRFNKAQQDAFLPFIEDGTFILVGATTENPSFALNNALLSRLRVLTLRSLSETALEQIVARYEKTFSPLPLTPHARTVLVQLAQGDGRHLLNMIENLQNTTTTLDTPHLLKFVQRRSALYDKHEEGHHNLISALHKSVRGSDPDAALYWLARMLEGGEAPEYIARRMVRMAVEDIGLADPEALSITLNAWRAFDQLGSPEGELALAQAIIYLALAPKSNAAYTAFSEAKQLASETTHLNPPAIILNAPTALMRELGYGKGYAYDHDTPDAFSGQNYFPDGMPRPSFYKPAPRGFEREMDKRLAYFSRLRSQKNQD